MFLVLSLYRDKYIKALGMYILLTVSCDFLHFCRNNCRQDIEKRNKLSWSACRMLGWRLVEYSEFPQMFNSSILVKYLLLM